MTGGNGWICQEQLIQLIISMCAILVNIQGDPEYDILFNTGCWNFRTWSTFPVQVCTVTSSMDKTNRCNKVDTVRLYPSYRLNLLLLKGQLCVAYETLSHFTFYVSYSFYVLRKLLIKLYTPSNTHKIAKMLFS